MKEQEILVVHESQVGSRRKTDSNWTGPTDFENDLMVARGKE